MTTTAKCRSCDAPKLIHLVKGDLDWIVMKCLEKDRTHRYETANGLVMDVKRHVNNEPILARPPSVAYRFQKSFRRNKLMFTAATAVALALVAGIGVSTWQAVEARKARNGEKQQRLAAQRAQKNAETQQRRAEEQAREASESRQRSRRLLYASDMNLAQQALKMNNLGRARQLLDRHRPQPDEDDLRGWEWRYLWQQTHSSALVTLTNRPGRGLSVSFPPDGSRLAVGWSDGRLDLWDTADRRLVRTLTDGGQTYWGRVAFCPIANLLAATSAANVVSLYDLDSGRKSNLWRVPEQGAWDIRDLEFSQDGSRLVIYAGSHSQELGDAVWVVNVSSSTIESRHSTVFSDISHFGGAQISPDNRLLYLARSDCSNYHYTIQCIELGTGKEVWQTKPERDLGLAALAISPDGRVLASGSGYQDSAIRVWDAATGRLLVRLEGHTGWVCRLVFARDGHRLVSAASDQTIRIRGFPRFAQGHSIPQRRKEHQLLMRLPCSPSSSLPTMKNFELASA